MFKKNLKALLQIDPHLATKIARVKTNEKFEVFVDEKDPININLYDRKNDFIFYKTKPVDEIAAEYEELMKQYARYPYMFFFGVANGLLVKMFSNLDKTLFVFEPEIELLYIVFNLFNFSDAILKRKVRFYLLEDVTYAKLDSFLSHKEMKAFLKTYTLQVTHEYYFRYHNEEIHRLNSMIAEQISYIVTSEGNDVIDSLLGLKHHIVNLDKMIASYPLSNVVKKRNTDYAVIVSTGPSLAKQIPLLKKHAKNLTILCVDASMPILRANGIKPDFVFTIERDEPTAHFYDNLDKEFFKDTIFFITSIVHKKLLQNLKGMKICMTMRPFEHLQKFHLGRWGYIGVGMSAANMAMEYVYATKYKAVALIGQDLAFGEDGSTHSEGALFGEMEKNYTTQKKFKLPGYYGGEVETTKVWLMFYKYFTRDIPYLKEAGIDVYNCTEGGAYIEGAEHIPFAKFLEKIEKKEKKLLRFRAIPKKKQVYLVQSREKYTDKLLCHFEQLNEKIKAVFLDLMEKLEYIEKLNKEKRVEEIDFEFLKQTIEKIDTVKDIYETDSALKGYGNITNPYILHAELELAKIVVRNTKTDIEKKTKMIDWLYAHKSWLFFLSGAIEATTDTIRIAKEERVDSKKIVFVDVIVDNKKIDFITFDKVENIYDIKQKLLEYELDKKYIKKADKLKFVYVFEDSSALDAFLVNRYQNGFERFSFNTSLKTTYNPKLIKDKNNFDTLTFMATSENYTKFEFVELLRKVLLFLPNVKIKAVAFSKQDEDAINELFIDQHNQIEFIKPLNFYELINQTDVYIKDKDYKNEYARKLDEYMGLNSKKIIITEPNKEKEEEYLEWSILENLNYTPNSIDEVYIYHDNNLVDTIKPTFNNNFSDIKQPCFEYIIKEKKDFKFKYKLNEKEYEIAMPKADDEKIYEYSFINSLETTFDESYRDVYEKNSIGFLATQEYMQDRFFTTYIKRLAQYIPNATIKAFYFTDAQKEQLTQCFSNIDITPIFVKHGYTIETNVELFILSYRSKLAPPYNKFKRLFEKLTCFCDNIHLAPFNSDSYVINMTVGEQDKIEPNSLQYKVLIDLVKDEAIIKRYNYNLWITVLQFLLEKYNIDSSKYNFDGNKNLFEFHYLELFKLLLEHREIKGDVKQVFRGLNCA